MASSNYFSSDPYRRHSGQTLRHKVSNLSDSSDSPGPHQGRESLVSLQSLYEPPTLPSPKGSSPEQQWLRGGPSLIPFRLNNSARYQPISSPPLSSGRFKSFRARMQDTILEDENINMSALSATASPSHSKSYSAVPKEEPVEPVVDMTSFSGPMAMLDEEFLRSLQEQEASGKLTGGLGQGDVPSTVIRGEELTSPPPSSARSLTRSSSMKRATAFNLRQSWKSVGQEEASKGEDVDEVIVDEPVHADLSSVTAPQTAHRGEDHAASLPPKKQILYPTSNWKPFVMRWPYLLFLVILSILLGIIQELVYQMSTGPGGLFHFKNTQDFDPGPYAVFKYVPTLIAVTYGVLWQIADSEVRRLEVFYQMSREGGALLAESINADYATSFNFMRLFFFVSPRGHLTVATSSVATFLAVFLVPILGAAALIFAPDSTQLLNPNVVKVITVSAVVSRLLTITFFVIAVLGCGLIYQLTTRRSGLVADVEGIAGLASMTVVSNIMVDFKDMDTAKPKNIHHKLKNRRYELRNSSIFSEDLMLVGTRKTNKYKNPHLSGNPHPLMLRKEGCIPFIFGLVLFFALMLVFLFTRASIIIHKAPWVVTALAVCIKLAWGSLETSIRIFEPYYILTRRHAPAKTLILDYTAMSFATTAIHGFLNRHWIVFLVSLGAILVEALVILATSLSLIGGKEFLDFIKINNDDVLSKELGSGSEAAVIFVTTLALTGVILLYLCVTTIIVFVYRRRPFLPRQPSTIASVLAFIHQSKMLYSFVGTSEFTKAQMREKIDELDKLGKTYGMGWFSGRDGLTHYGIDEEELTADYQHVVKRDREEVVS